MFDHKNEEGIPSVLPVFRIWTCGTFRVEKRTDRGYAPIRTAEWGGSNYPRLLLKVLLCCPGRRARREALLEMLWPRYDLEQAVQNLNTGTTKLRRVLCPSKGQASLLVTEDDNARSYELASQLLLWIDADAALALLKEAERIGPTSIKALPLLEQAIEYLSAGMFLEDEEAGWLYGRRGDLDEARYNGRLWLAEAYVQQGMIGQAELQWRALLTDDPTDEDVLRQVMLFLHEHGMTHKALRLCQQIAKRVAEEGLELTDATRMLQARIHSQQQTTLPELISRETLSTASMSMSELGAGAVSIEKDFSKQDKGYPQFWNVPYQRNPFFTGREKLLTYLYGLLNQNSTILAVTQHALYGLGGIGKTQIVLEYAYRYGDEYQAVIWVRADTRENLLSDMYSIATLLKLPEQNETNQVVVVTAVKRWLQEQSGWLLIFDNADDLVMVREFLPTGYRGHLLLTTRAQALGGLAHRIEIEEMSQDIGALFLLRRAGILSLEASLKEASEIDCILAREIVLELGGLPLALDQAGAYIEESLSSLQEYLRFYHKQRFSLLKRRGGLTTDHPEPVATTWFLSFRRVEQIDPLAAGLLRLCSFLDPDVIPEEIMSVYIHTLGFPQETKDVDDQIRANEALSVLLRFSLIQRNPETKTLTIHRLVQATMQDAMDKEAQHTWIERAIQVVSRAFPYTSAMYSTSGRPHCAVQLLRVSIHRNQEYGNKENLAVELWKIAVQQQVLGRLKASEQSLQEGLALCSEIGDRFHEAKTHQYFALLRAYQGWFPTSFQHLETAVSLFKEANIAGVESALSAYRSLCALLAGDFQTACMEAQCAWKQANVQRNERDMIRAAWILGNALIRQTSEEADDDSQTIQHLEAAETYLWDALERCRRSETVDYEADLLLAWARLHYARGDHVQAKASAMEALTITNRSAFRVLRADIHVLLAQLALDHGDRTAAMLHAQAAFDDALCDGIPYCYQSALEGAKHLLEKIKKLASESSPPLR